MKDIIKDVLYTFKLGLKPFGVIISIIALLFGIVYLTVSVPIFSIIFAIGLMLLIIYKMGKDEKDRK